MKTKQTIAVIGATGNMGTAISSSLAKGNYRLLLMGEEPVKLDELATKISEENPSADITVVQCPKEAGWEADIIIPAVPYEAQADVAEKIREVANQKIVISIANPLNASYNGLVTRPGSSAGQELQALLPNSKVVKAFNTTFAADFSTPVIDGKQADAFIAGDDEEAVQTVTELVKTTGFKPVVAGGLDVSGTLEHMQLLLIQLTMKNNYNWLAGWKILHN
jgi:hypothetical protein